MSFSAEWECCFLVVLHIREGNHQAPRKRSENVISTKWYYIHKSSERQIPLGYRRP